MAAQWGRNSAAKKERAMAELWAEKRDWNLVESTVLLTAANSALQRVVEKEKHWVASLASHLVVWKVAVTATPMVEMRVATVAESKADC